MSDRVELIDAMVRIQARGHETITKVLAREYVRELDNVEAALGIDDYVVTDYNDAGDITGLERNTFDDSFAGDPIWKAIAPFVDPGDYLTYRQTYDGRTYRVVFDGAGSYVTATWRMTFD